jgi:hypothetical protein
MRGNCRSVNPTARKRGLRLFGTIGAIAVLLGLWRPAEAATPSSDVSAGKVPVGKPMQPTVPHLYWLFLMYQNHLDRAAAVRQQSGKDSAWLRDHFQRRLGFTDTQFGVVRASALRLEVDLKTINLQARLITQSDMVWRRQQGVDQKVPGPGHVQIQQLQKESEGKIENEIDRLNRELGPEPSAKLEAFITKEWINHVSAKNSRRHIHPPENRNKPSTGRLQLEVQP